MRPLRLIVVTAALALAGCAASQAVDVSSTLPDRATTTSDAPPPATTRPTTAPATTATTAAGPTSPTSSTTLPPQTLAWKGCGEGVQCATLTVPLDYADPSKGTIDLNVKRHPATSPDRRIGSLLVNPGGPGVAGSALAENPGGYFSKTLRQRFDIVAWDPRGTGASSPVDCVSDLDPYLSLDPTPDTPAEEQALIDAGKDFAAKCEAKSGRILPYISTQDSARDMEELRKALGEEKVSYFGFSYGSELGATFATMFPGSLRATVLDGAIDPNSSSTEQAEQQVRGFERSLDNFFADCGARSKCPFRNGGDPGAAFDRLLADLDASPLRLGDRAIGQAEVYTAIISALNDRAQWPLLAQALASAQEGDAEGIAYLNDTYVHRNSDGTYDNLFEALIAINCLDDPGPTDVAYPDRLAGLLEAIAPRLGRASAYGYFCTFWPARPRSTLLVDGKGAGPILVVGTTGDPVTPLESSRLLAQSLDGGVLLTVEADHHTGYGENACSIRVVDRYLTDLVAPPEGEVCRS